MGLKKRGKRWVYLAHRWTGIFGCLLMALWFASGVVMLYVGLPKLTPWERLAALPALALPLERPPAVQGDGWVLTSIGGQPRWLHGTQAFSADGTPQQRVTPQQALAEVQRFVPQAHLRYGGQQMEDLWTHARALDAHRPLYRIEAGGEGAGSYYVSSKSGQLLLDAPLWQQRWNYVGAWLRNRYSQSVDPLWTIVLMLLSGLCTLTALSGILVGLWRMRFRTRYKNGAHTPYRTFWMRWHHLLGMAFGLLVFTWIFSGLMSMNPLDPLLPDYPPPDRQAFGKAGAAPAPLLQPAAILRALQQADFVPVELHFKHLNGQAYVLAFNNRAQTRLVQADTKADTKDALKVAEHWPADAVLPAAQQLFAAPIAESRVLTAYDSYYRQRHPEAMMGAMQYGLPALRLQFEDSGQTLVYIDLQTGEVAQSLDKIQRLRRWWFFFLHSWDTPALLQAGVFRDLAIILLSAGGLFVALSGALIGWRRLRGRAGAR